jgi:hypothetical protein
MRQPSNKQPQTANHVMAGKKTQVKHNNHYDPLFNEPECHTCHNYGHKSADCRLRNYESDLNPSAENVKVWKKKENDKCGLVFSSQNKKPLVYRQWMLQTHDGDKDKFLSISKIKTGNVTFGNDELQVKSRVKGW